MTYFFANWKSYLSVEESIALASEVGSVSVSPEMEICIFPSAIAFTDVRSALLSSQIHIGAQHLVAEKKNGQTGDITAHQFVEAGAMYALVGHSEQRALHGETDQDVAMQAQACIDAGLVPVICVGESKEIRDAGEAVSYVCNQVTSVIRSLSMEARYIIAYEPIWAIGADASCDPQDAQDMAVAIYEIVPASIPVLYGGSVTPDNIDQFTSQASISGVLVGRASTQAESMKQMITL